MNSAGKNPTSASKIDPIPPSSAYTASQIGSVLIDPTLDPVNLSTALDILPLIVDTTIVVQPTQENLATWNYNFQRFNDLVRNDIFLPFFTSGETNPFGKGIDRSALVQDPEFFGLYELSIQHDLEDDTFCNIAEDYGAKPLDMAYNVNWDLIMAQLIRSPVISPPSLQSIWEHKLISSIRDLSAISALPPEAEHAKTLTTFLSRVFNDMPSALSVEQLVRFRQHQSSQNFRSWFRSQIQSGRVEQSLGLGLDDNIYNEFRKLARKYSRGNKRMYTSVSALTSAAGAVIGTMLGNATGAAAGAGVGSLLGSASTYAFQNVLRHVWQDRRPDNWVFMFLDFRSELSL